MYVHAKKILHRCASACLSNGPMRYTPCGFHSMFSQTPHAHTHTRILTHTYTHAHTHIHTHALTHTHLHARSRARAGAFTLSGKAAWSIKAGLYFGLWYVSEF